MLAKFEESYCSRHTVIIDELGFDIFSSRAGELDVSDVSPLAVDVFDTPGL